MASMEKMSSGNVDCDTAFVSNSDHDYNYVYGAYSKYCVAIAVPIYVYYIDYAINAAMDIKKVY